MSQISIENIVERAQAAQSEFEAAGQEDVDELIVGLAWAILEPETNRSLSKQAVLDTGLGDAEDKITKNHRKTLGLLRDLQNAPSVGVIRELPEQGLVEIARPVGVVGAIVPSTNPIATPLNKTLNAVKGRNAIILSPSPKGNAICERVVDLLQEVLRQHGHPENLIQKMPSPVSFKATHELMQQVDLLVVTGAQINVRAAYSSGTPAIGVGAGNVSVIIDETADLPSAARKVVASKTFDNATSCSSENSLVIVDEVYEQAITALQAEGGVLLNPEETQTLRDNLWMKRELNPNLIAKSASEIAAAVGFQRPDMANARMLLVEETGTGYEYPFSGEKLSPVLTLYRAANFDAACRQVREIYDFQGKGHSVGLHSIDESRPMQIGLNLPTCRVIVNQAHCFATGGSFDNGLPFSLSMGCGTWGGNSISENLNYRHYLNIVRIVRPITPAEPSVEDIFGSYWAKHGR
ncbi:MAG: Sulfoacetaldehyde dehydrogenase (acylating) [Deltaproteobacteria bacterium]|jgi:sulfoacetaldehyde dehydrogenase|nr:Sulfoacetaldehyde dehydrogenase (acylating) [Deltaproteobacteria bacterium]